MADKPDFELYGFWRTSATYRVRVALNLKGLAAHEHFIDLDAGDQRSEAFLKINPLGAIPALIEEGHPPLTQSLAILEFLDETHPAPALLPKDPYGRARVRSIAAMLAADTHPLIVPRVRKYLAEVGGFDAAAVRTWMTHWFATGLAAVEKRLASESATGKFCHGDQVTIADICLASITVLTRVNKLVMPPTPIVDRIFARCEELDAFAKADPLKQRGAPAAA
jgi:maleylacetoacetate isomerase